MTLCQNCVRALIFSVMVKALLGAWGGVVGGGSVLVSRSKL